MTETTKRAQGGGWGERRGRAVQRSRQARWVPEGPGQGQGSLPVRRNFRQGLLFCSSSKMAAASARRQKLGLRLWLQTGTSYHQHQGRGERLTQQGGYEGMTTVRNSGEREPSLRRPQPHPAQSQDGCEVRDSQPCTADHLGSFFKSWYQMV